MNKAQFELYLLRMWLDKGMEEVFKYKNRIKWFRDREELVAIELFNDVSGSLFSDVVDIADHEHSYPNEHKVSVQELIERRKLRQMEKHSAKVGALAEEHLRKFREGE